jgi:hypothetical protein
MHLALAAIAGFIGLINVVYHHLTLNRVINDFSITFFALGGIFGVFVLIR